VTVKDAGALSVTARWGLCKPYGSAQNTTRKVKFSYDSSAMRGGTGSAIGGANVDKRLSNSLDAEVLRNAMAGSTHQESGMLQLKFGNSDGDENLSSIVNVVPPLDLTSVIDAPQSILRYVFHGSFWKKKPK
jgi:hypothetical protein